MPRIYRRTLVLLAVVCLATAVLQVAGEEPTLTEEQMTQFLLNAQVVKSEKTKKGVTSPRRLKLSDGTLTHDAAFQSIDDYQRKIQLPGKLPEYDFRDSYHFNIAAYELAKLVGLGDMIPVTVEYKFKGKKGSLCWWVPAKWDLQDRYKEKIPPPDVNVWNKQMNRMWVFAQLVYDTDRNQTIF